MNAYKEHGTTTDRLTTEHSRPMARVALRTAGILCVGLGILGAFLPVLPTTPFLLLAAACCARTSRRFCRRLQASRMFGPLIDEWRGHRQGDVPRHRRL